MDSFNDTKLLANVSATKIVSISILGLGYVGAVSLACLARDGHDVIGVDIDESKCRLINAGKTPCVEEGMPELMSDVVASGNVTVTSEVKNAINSTEISFVCVGTPSGNNGSQDQSALLEVTREIGKALRNKSSPHTIVFRSTVTPGTVENTLIPLLEMMSGKKEGNDFYVAFQPEFLREGSSIKDYDNPPFTIVGARSQAAFDVLYGVFGHLPCKFFRTSIAVSEILKYCCNNFHALKITFANETARLCEALKINPFEVMELMCEDHHLNISKAYLTPGFAFGGSCLPKDLRATTYFAKEHDVELPVLSHIIKSNQLHLEQVVKKVLATGRKKIGLIGLAFKSGTDDLRESPMVDLAERLIGKGLEVNIYDPYVNLSSLLGANLNYIEKHLPHIGKLLKGSLHDVISHESLVVIGINDLTVMEEVRSRLTEENIIVDVVNISDASKWPGKYIGCCW